MNTTAKISTTASEAANLPAADPGRAPDLGPHFTSDWDAALAIYSTKRAASDAMRDDAEGVDEAVDAYCEAMDYLIEKVPAPNLQALFAKRSEEHTSELQSLMRISYAVFCLKKKKKKINIQHRKSNTQNVRNQQSKNTLH